MTLRREKDGGHPGKTAWKKAALAAAGLGLVAASYEVFCPRATFLGRVSVRGPAGVHAVALAFPRSPDLFTEEVCRTLHELEVPGNFFIVGERARANPRATRAMRPFEIGVHAEVYAPLVFKSSSTIRALVRPAAELASQIQNRPAAFLMPPFGWKGPGLLAAASSMGLRVINPTRRLELGGHMPARPAIDTVLSRISPGEILLLSLKHGLERQDVLEPLSHLVSGLRSKGLGVWGLRALLNMER